MKNKITKINIMVLMLIILTANVTALNYKVGTTATFWGSCIDGTGVLGGDNMSLTIYYPNATLWVNQTNMTWISAGTFQYNATIPNITGTYTLGATCYDGGNTQSATEEFQVVSVEATDFISIDVTSTSESGFDTNMILWLISVAIGISIFIYYHELLGAGWVFITGAMLVNIADNLFGQIVFFGGVIFLFVVIVKTIFGDEGG